ncbi:MAG: metallophosphoesterase [Phycisphaerales bacterium]
MKLLLVQLSDIHLREGRANPVCDRARAIAQAAYSACPDAQHILLLITGDVAYAGKPEEYTLAHNFVQSVADFLIKRRGPDTSLRLAFIPGNHDCDFSTDQSAREKLLSTLSAEDLGKSSIYDVITEPQANFNTFVRRFRNLNVVDTLSRPLTNTDLDLDGYAVRLTLLNTSACSVRHEQPGQLKIAWHSLAEAGLTGATPDLAIVLAHHPLHWLEPESMHALRKHCMSTKALLMTGHEHTPAQLQLQQQAQLSHLIEGGALQLSSTSDHSHFNVAVADFDNGQLSHTTLRWHQTLYLSDTPHPLSWNPAASPHASNVRLTLSKSRSRDIDDIGAPLVHPRKTQLSLSDVFVMSDLRELPGPLSIHNERKIVAGDQVIDRLLEAKHAYIHGPARSGKTALANRIFHSLWWQVGKLPLYATGEDLRSNTDAQLKACISKAIESNYKTNHVDEYLNSSHPKCIIIDGLSTARVHRGRQEEILSYLSRVFETIIVLDRNSLELSDLTFRDKSLPTLSQMACFDILPLSRTTRSELVERWVRLGRSGFDDEQSVDSEVVEKDKLIDVLIGRDLVLPTPFNILSLLAAVEQGASTDENLGSIGYLYDTLIRGALLQCVEDRSLLQTYDLFLSNLAFQLRSRRRLVVSVQEFEDACDEFATRHLIELSSKRLLKECIAAQILACEGDSVAFRYRYVFYFFTARYLSQRLSTEAGRNAVTELVDHVEGGEASKILLFLCYCTSDPFVIETVLKRSKSILDFMPEANLEADTEFLLGENDRPQRLQLDNESPSKNRRSLLRERDSQDEAQRLLQVDRPLGLGDEDEDRSEEDLQHLHAGQVVAALRMCEVVGQILRNHVTIEGETKSQLIREGMGLTRRVLATMLADMQETSVATIEQVEIYIQSQKSGMPDDKAALLARRIFSLNVQQLTVGIISLYASELGNTVLKPAFKRVLSEQCDDTSKIIDLAVKLENPRAFPEHEALELERRFRGHVFIRECLTGMVFMYLYLYGVSDYKKRQKVCAKFGIEVQQPALMVRHAKRLSEK